MLRFDNDNRKRKKKKKKKKHIRKLKGFLEYLDPRFQKKTREKEESSPPGGYSREQYRNQGSKQPYKDGKPSGAGESQKYSSVTSSEYVKGKGPQDVCRTPFYSHRHYYLKQSLNARAMKSLR